MSPYVYDIALLAIMLICIFAGYKRGVMRTVLGIFCFIAAFTAATVLSSFSVTSAIYEKYFHKEINEYIDVSVNNAKEKVKEKFNNEAEIITDAIIDELAIDSDEMKTFIKEQIFKNADSIIEIIPELYSFFNIDLRTLLTNPTISGKINNIAADYSSMIADEINGRLPFGITVKKEYIQSIITDYDAEEALILEIFGINSEVSGETGLADYIERAIVCPIVMRILSLIIWIIVFLTVNFVLRVIVRIILIIRNIKPIKTCDSLLGGVLGAAAGGLVIAAGCMLIMMLMQLTGGMANMNDDFFSRTIIFGKIYDIVSGMGIIVPHESV